jgi:hypothetical protein
MQRACIKGRLCCSRVSTARIPANRLPYGYLRQPGLLREGTVSVSSLKTCGSAATFRDRAPCVIESRGSHILVMEEELRSTWTHRAWVGGTTAVLAHIAARGSAALTLNKSTSAVAVVGAILAAYLLADFVTGVYHWALDNYGSPATPLVGGQVVAVQLHHVQPLTNTDREFANTSYKVFKPFLPVSILYLAVSAGRVHGAVDIFISLFSLLLCMSQQIHAWCHMKLPAVPGVVRYLQNVGVLISRQDHSAHHHPPFNRSYCCVSGVCNQILDDWGFFRVLEKLILEATGWNPRYKRERRHLTT